MKVIVSTTHDAYFNIAAEEYLFHHFSDDIFYLYINSPSIIVGRKQNTMAEINYDYVTQHNIPVVRRLSGGGAVFHDLGNLNFCFIVHNNVVAMSSSPNIFTHYTAPIIAALQSLGVNAQLQGRNDIVIDGKKCSGNAKYQSKGTMLQHGTLLFASNLTDISQALRAAPEKFADKAVKSISSRVTNISEHLTQPLSMEEFTQKIIDYMIGNRDNHPLTPSESGKVYNFSEKDIYSINALVETKYSTYEWNYGKSPAYNYTKSLRTAGGSLQVSMVVKKGVIETLHFYGDFFSHKDIDEYEKLFANVPHHHNAMTAMLAKHPAEEYFVNITNDDIIKIIF